MSLKTLTDKVQQYYTGTNLSIIEKAYHFAEAAHKGQMRESGDNYFQHPYQVALILADLELDLDTITAGLLHDVLEDTDISPETVAQEFGYQVVMLVEGVTKLKRLPFTSRYERQAENLRKMILAMAKDIRVILIKLADRLHNMRTLRHLAEEKQQKIARETMDIYAPLAHRLGIWKLKWEMEDLSFRYLHPKEYYHLVNALDLRLQEREGDIEAVKTTIVERLKELKIEGDIEGRPKHLYSIHQKMVSQRKALDEIYDLTAVRVIVETVRDCYAVLGTVHTIWKPIPGRFKDYIAMPKRNMYQSLHTTVIGTRGKPMEIQIRTGEMHRIAEKGVAAHWLYKEGGSKKQSYFDKVKWLREAVEWLQEMKDPQEFMETFKVDLFEDEVYVFTPKGDVKSLPIGSTPIDFAFEIHSDIGVRCVGAKVNGRIVPLDYQLNNGEFVEILTSKNASPTQDWLKIVKTSKARNRIRAFLREEQREENLLRGREILEKEIRKADLEPKEIILPDKLDALAKRYGVGNGDELVANIGFGRIAARQILQKLAGDKLAETKPKSKVEPRPKKQRKQDATGVRVEGIDNVLVRFSKCCTPVPGDDIVGYITRGRGVSVHRTDCPNIKNLATDQSRQIRVFWETKEDESFPVDIEIRAMDRVNLLSTLVNAASEGDTNIEAVNARTIKDNTAVIHLVVDIRNIDHMKEFITRIRQVKGVISVRRANPT